MAKSVYTQQSIEVAIVKTKLGRKLKQKQCECGFIGSGKTDFPYEGKGKCKSCVAKVKQQAKDARKPVCKRCGKRFAGRHDKVFCSEQCKQETSADKKEYRVFECKACGKCNEGLEWKASKPKQVCDARCQRILAGYQKDLRKASIKAKLRWIKESSAKRKLKNDWFGSIAKKAQKTLGANSTRDRWKARCQSASSMLGKRLESASTFRLKANNTWFSCVESQFRRIKAKAKRERQSLWMLKCGTKARSLRLRRSLRNARLSM